MYFKMTWEICMSTINLLWYIFLTDKNQRVRHYLAIQLGYLDYYENIYRENNDICPVQKNIHQMIPA